MRSGRYAPSEGIASEHKRNDAAASHCILCWRLTSGCEVQAQQAPYLTAACNALSCVAAFPPMHVCDVTRTTVCHNSLVG